MSDKSKILDNLRKIEALVTETKALLENHAMYGIHTFDSPPPTTPKDPEPHPH